MPCQKSKSLMKSGLDPPFHHKVRLLFFNTLWVLVRVWKSSVQELYKKIMPQRRLINWSYCTVYNEKFVVCRRYPSISKFVQAIATNSMHGSYLYMTVKATWNSGYLHMNVQDSALSFMLNQIALNDHEYYLDSPACPLCHSCEP